MNGLTNQQLSYPPFSTTVISIRADVLPTLRIGQRVCRQPAAASLLIIASGLLLSGCSAVLFSLANAPSHFTAVQRTIDIPYGDGPRQRLDVYVPGSPAPNSQPFPVVVFWYGGGWTKGDKSLYRFVGTTLAENGFVAVLPDYRVFPQVKFPQFVDDGASAVAWVQAHVGEYGGDTEHIVLMGHSAGAHQAALLAMEQSYLRRAGGRPESIVGLVGLSGPYHLIPDSDLLRQIFAAPYTPPDWQPDLHVSSQAPPTLLIHGADDDIVVAAHADRFQAALNEAGVPVSKLLYPHRGHADTVMAFSSLARFRLPALDRIVSFIQRVSNPQTKIQGTMESMESSTTSPPTAISSSP